MSGPFGMGERMVLMRRVLDETLACGVSWSWRSYGGLRIHAAVCESTVAAQVSVAPPFPVPLTSPPPPSSAARFRSAPTYYLTMNEKR